MGCWQPAAAAMALGSPTAIAMLMLMLGSVVALRGYDHTEAGSMVFGGHTLRTVPQPQEDPRLCWAHTMVFGGPKTI